MTDPWELLKEARHYVTQTTTNFERYDRDFLARIDAALAKYDRESAWTVCGSWANYRGELGEGFVCDNQVPLDSPFFWRIKRKDGTGTEGWADSRDEARDKAITALRKPDGY